MEDEDYGEDVLGLRAARPASEMYTYNAIVESVVDGDTFHASVDLGFGIWTRGMTSETGVLFRLLGCNARELHDRGGPEAKDHLASVLTPGMRVVLQSVKADKYGDRFDAKVTLPDGTDLVATLIAQQWAAAWDGVGTKKVPPWPRRTT